MALQEQIELLGNRVVIKLDEVTGHKVTESGLHVPKFGNELTEGGKPIPRTSSDKHLSVGTVVLISPGAKIKFEEEGSTLEPGDRVYVALSSVSPRFQFFLDRDTLLPDFDGHICVAHSQVEAKINTNENHK
jgi:co-chaperonin GroES (HSP10)